MLKAFSPVSLSFIQCSISDISMKREMHLHLCPSPRQLDTDITLSVCVTPYQSNTLFQLAALKWHIS